MDAAVLPANRNLSCLKHMKIALSADEADAAVCYSPSTHPRVPPLLIVEIKKGPVVKVDMLSDEGLDGLPKMRPGERYSAGFNQHRLLLQPLSYLKQLGGKYACLSTCERQFYIKRTGEDDYKVSPVVYGRDCKQAISAREATYAMLQMSIEDPSTYEPRLKSIESAPVFEAAEQQAAHGAGGGSDKGAGAGSSLGPHDQGGHDNKRQRRSAETAMLSACSELRHTEECVTLLGRLDGLPVAVKAVSTSNQRMVTALQHEAAVYGQLQHLQGECVPVLKTMGIWHDMFVVVTELIHGSHVLEDVLAEGTPLPMDLSQQAEKALTCIHDAGVLHGDMHPSNIVFNHAPLKVWFLDFAGSHINPPPTHQEKQAELQELRNILRVSRSSDASDREIC